jgi:hypothetical protein
MFMTRRMRLALSSVVLAGSASFSGLALAADVFVQPSGYISAESNSNLDLTPGGQAEVTGYIADFASVIGIATPNSTTTVRPRVDYRDYPSDSTDNRLEEYLDFNSDYKNQRSAASISGTLDHRDEFNAELTPALYDDLNPTQPTAPQTGRTLKGATRDSVILIPSYSFKVTPLVATGVSAIYQKVNYSPDNSGRFVDFDFYQGKAFVVWTLDQKSDLTFGAFGNRYNATRFESTGTSGGGSVQLDTAWTPLFSTQASLALQHSNIDYGIPPTFNGSVNTWGGSLTALYKVQTSQFRADLSRILTPSGGGSVYINNQLQGQYSRSLTPRLTLTGAAVYLRNRALTANASGNGRDYLRSVAEVKWMIARTWYVQGGYQYTWQKYQLDPDGAANNRVYIRFGYQGLDRQW